LYETKGDESYLRKIIKPIENLLVDMPKVIVKDTAVNAICYGGKLLLPGVLRFSHGIDINQEIVLVTTKGEAVAVGIA
jgi:H/ACA ribonucleoprotein complex subunit 4